MTSPALRDALEALAKEFDERAGKPIDNPTKPIDWANHGERMAYLRCAAFIRREALSRANSSDVSVPRDVLQFLLDAAHAFGRPFNKDLAAEWDEATNSAAAALQSGKPSPDTGENE